MTTNSGDGWNCFQYSFAPERADVIAHLARVRGEMAVALAHRVRRLGGREIPVDRHLRIDDDRRRRPAA